MKINWLDPTCPISTHFTVGDATYLPSSKCHHITSPEEQANILKVVEVLEKIRTIVGKPIKVHVWIRPSKVNAPTSHFNGEDYNAKIGGAKGSAHITGEAVDWGVMGMSCDSVRTQLVSKLQALGARMEDLPQSTWIHIDIRKPGTSGHRFFVP